MLLPAVLVLLALSVPQSEAATEVTAACPLCDEGAALVERFQLEPMEQPLLEWPGWAPPRRIIVAVGGPPVVADFQTIAPDAEVIFAPMPETAAAMAGADVFFGWCTPEIIAAGQSLRWVQIPSAGADTCTAIPAVAERDILVTNLQRIHGPQVAEHALGMMLSFGRKLHMLRDHQREGHFEGVHILEFGMIELHGRTLLIAGLGGIGTELARRAHALGMRVIATRNSSREGPDFVEYVGLADELHDLAGRADFVVSVVPLTDETRGMYDAAFFQAMRPSAYFINMGRGESVMTDDLVAALRDGTIAGAGLDVTDPQPLPPDHPLWSMSTVILTPHVAAASEEMVTRAVALALENLRRYVAGDRLVSRVDLRRGY